MSRRGRSTAIASWATPARCFAQDKPFICEAVERAQGVLQGVSDAAREVPSSAGFVWRAGVEVPSVVAEGAWGEGVMGGRSLAGVEGGEQCGPFGCAGAGVGGARVAELTQRGDEPILLRRSEDQIEGARTISADAGDRTALRQHARGADAIVHAIHAPYDPAPWRRELPHREQAVMDVAEGLQIPVLFPESVYAFGHAAEDLPEGAPLDPCTPLGEVRAELLQARRAHGARTISIVAGDLIGPTATVQGSVPTATVIGPVRAGRTAWVLGDPDARHSMTWIPDLARTIIAAAERSDSLAPHGDAVLHASTPPAISLRELAEKVAHAAGRPAARIRRAPWWPLAAAGMVSPVMRSLSQQRYLWDRPMMLGIGAIEGLAGLAPTGWDAIVEELVPAASAA